MYTYAHISNFIETVYELPLLPNNTASETFSHKFGAVRSVDWIFVIGVSAWQWLGRIGDIGQKVLQSSLQTGSSSSSPSYCNIFFFFLYLKQTFIKNIIIILWINYIIITFINNNNVVINNLWKTPSLCSAHQNSHGHAKGFLLNIVYRQFGHALCKRFASPGLRLTTL